MKKIIALGAMLLMVLTAMAQMEDPVKFSAELKTGKTAEAEIVFSARIDAGWHIYSTRLGGGGPTEASLHVNKADGVELVGQAQGSVCYTAYICFAGADVSLEEAWLGYESVCQGR